MLKLGGLVQFCLLLGVKRTLVGALHMSANDPKRTLLSWRGALFRETPSVK